MKRIFLLLMLCVAVGIQAQQRSNVTSVLEVLDVQTGQRTVLKEFPYLIEAPNWTVDGKWIIYNSNGLIYKLAADGKGEVGLINTEYVVRCNNDHVLSADGNDHAPCPLLVRRETPSPDVLIVSQPVPGFQSRIRDLMR